MDSTVIETFPTGQAYTGMSYTDQQVSRQRRSNGSPRYSRRLSDKILIAVHYACDQNDYEVANALLDSLEMMLIRPALTRDGMRHRNIESLVAAHERLWNLLHPITDDY